VLLPNECLLLFTTSTQSGNFWIHLRTVVHLTEYTFLIILRLHQHKLNLPEFISGLPYNRMLLLCGIPHCNCYGLDDRLFRFRQRQKFVSIVSKPALGPIQPLNQWISGSFSLEAKWPGREDDHSPPPTGEVKNAWSYTSTPHKSSYLGA